ncbi:hypothetical protein MFMK1_002530 [Metallumcola ferriviriculae]|uniref:Uncharacterized protein n=1 Tax=Metallumcola ferriviriculae TaxID=3039180 RepID=A0AAU0UQ87_9FIRM|nr:hypothetical protein MFMK1_002530 [Desulfitibacteraceae bacterium MK1]
MFSFLGGFEKRMEIVGIVESIVNRKNRNMELERLFDDNDFLNLVFSVLLYIMEKTLSEDVDCDSEHILKFLEAMLPKYYGVQLDNNQLHQLTDYIIKNVLQNEGIAYHFQAVDYEHDVRKNITIRLIADHVHEVNGGYKITYALTDQGYDFLFRTKEVDQEIQMTIEELKLKELIKRKNFKKAHDQSRNLIQMVRQKKKEIQLFMMKIKENIHEADIGQYEKLINSTYDLLNEEYDLLSEVMDMSRKSEEKLRLDYESSLNLDASIKKAQAEIMQINYNIRATLSEQRDLILNRQSLSKFYIDTIGDSLAYGMENRYDLEEFILKQMEQNVEQVERFWQLVNPLFLPNVYKNINIRSIYEPQGMIKLEEEEKQDFIKDEDLSEDYEQEKIERVNVIYVEILDYLLRQALKNNGACRLEDIICLLEDDQDLFHRLTEERMIFTTLLKLYDIGVVNLAEWRNQGDKVVMNLSEEFNLEYCLYQLMDKYDYVRSVDKFEILKDTD